MVRVTFSTGNTTNFFVQGKNTYSPEKFWIFGYRRSVEWELHFGKHFLRSYTCYRLRPYGWIAKELNLSVTDGFVVLLFENISHYYNFYPKEHFPALFHAQNVNLCTQRVKGILAVSLWMGRQLVFYPNFPSTIEKNSCCHASMTPKIQASF